MEPIAFQIFFIYSAVTAGIVLWFIILYSTETDARGRQQVARATLLAWLWPIVGILALGYGVVKLTQHVPQFFKDAFRRSNESERRG